MTFWRSHKQPEVQVPIEETKISDIRGQCGELLDHLERFFRGFEAGSELPPTIAENFKKLIQDVRGSGVSSWLRRGLSYISSGDFEHWSKISKCQKLREA